MSHDELPLSARAADQAWFSMLLVNDPNTALVGTLRPTRIHPLWAALRRPFERALTFAPVAREAAEEMPGLRPRPARWLGAALLIALGVAGASAGVHAGLARSEASAATAMLPAGRLGTTTLQLHRAPLAEPAPPRVSADASLEARGAVVPGSDGAAARATPTADERRPQARDAAAAPPRAAKASVLAKPSVKKKAAARRRHASGRGPARRRDAPR